MRNQTREAFNAWVAQIAQLNGVPDASKKFAVSTPVEQTLETKIQESSAFLQRVNVVPVTDLVGEILGLYAATTLAGRTNTASDDRPTQAVHGMADIDYTCKQTNFDTHIKYSLLDTWAKFPDFQARLRDLVVRQMARDRILIGFNGASAAAATDRSTYPLLQDVNIGWIQKIKTDAAAQWLLDGDFTSGAEKEIRIGLRVAGTVDYDYLTLEGLVFDLVNSLVDPWHRDNPDLCVILGRDLLKDRWLSMIDVQTLPSEQLASEVRLLNKTLAGLRAYTVPYFPSRSVMVCPLPMVANGGSVLSIYYQEGSRRRAIIDNPKRDQIEDFQSVNEAYVVEDYGAVAGASNIIYPEEGTWVTGS